jgi:hypothetical protein
MVCNSTVFNKLWEMGGDLVDWLSQTAGTGTVVLGSNFRISWRYMNFLVSNDLAKPTLSSW